MPVMDLDTFRQRLMKAIICYEQKKVQATGRISTQRQADIHQLTIYIQSISDATLLENEMTRYLNQMPTKFNLVNLLFPRVSVLKELLFEIIRDENRQYTLYQMWLLSQKPDSSSNHHQTIDPIYPAIMSQPMP